jgi:hypothetical protein
MKITKQHRECFKEALENLPTDYLICHAIGSTTASEQVQKECVNILYYYFCDDPNRSVLWLPYADDLTRDELLTCRLIALYTLIYAPL